MTHPALTPRERQVARLAARGKSRENIAESLGIGEETVKLHLSRVYGKFKIGGHGAARELRLRRKEFGL